jgi:integrase
MAAKKYPIIHQRPVGRIIERGPQQFMVWLHSHTLADGRKKRYKKTWKTLKEADADLAQVVTRRNVGKGITDPNETLRTFVGRFLADAHSNRVKSYVHEKVSGAFKYWVFPYLGDRRVRNLRAADFQELYATLQKQVSPRTKKRLSPATIQRVHVHLRMAFNWGVRTGQLSRNQMDGVEVRKPARQKITVLTEQEVRLFLTAWDEYLAESKRARIPYGPLFNLAFETGMRPEEYLGLQWSDIELDCCPAVIRLQRVAIRDIAKGGWWFDEPKTPHSVRSLPMTPELAARLKEHRRAIEAYRERRGDRWQDHDLVFPNQTGEPIYHYLLTDVFRELIRRIGLDPKLYRLYTLRHTMATQAIARKANIKAVSERLGHASIARTLDTYTHVLPDMQAEVVEMLGAIAYKRGTEEKEEARADRPPLIDLGGANAPQERPF